MLHLRIFQRNLICCKSRNPSPSHLSPLFNLCRPLMARRVISCLHQRQLIICILTFCMLFAALLLPSVSVLMWFSFCCCLAPSAVNELTTTAIDSTSVKLSWRSPSHPNGLITQYKILVLIQDTVVQNITLTGRENVEVLTSALIRLFIKVSIKLLIYRQSTGCEHNTFPKSMFKSNL